MKVYKLLTLPLIALLVTLMLASPSYISAATPSPLAGLPPGDDAKVTRVVNGDTVEVVIQDIGFTIGYLGIQTPKPPSSTNTAQCYGYQALAYNARLVKGQTVRVEREVSDFTPTGRLLRWVFLPGGRLVNEELVKAGYAIADNSAPDHKYRDRLFAAQKAAQTAKLGMWGACAQAAIITSTLTITPDIPAITDVSQISTANPACPSASVCITAPASGTSVYPGTVVVFTGSATGLSFARYQFQAGNGSAWGHIAEFQTSVVNGQLMAFHTNSVPPGTYTIRLQVIDNTGNVSADKAEIVLTIGWGQSSYIPIPDASTPAGSGGGGNSRGACCKVCTVGKACGGCISRSYTCHKGLGCACDG